MKHNYVKQYKNIKIRQLNKEDLEFLRIWRNNPENTRFLKRVPYITSEMQIKWFQNYLNNDSEMTFAIDEVCTLHQIVGSLTLYNFEGTKAEVGKILVGDPCAHGMDVCTNALIAVMKIAKEELLLQRLYLHVYKENIPAMKVYKKVGFEIQCDKIVSNGKSEYTMEIEL